MKSRAKRILALSHKAHDLAVWTASGKYVPEWGTRKGRPLDGYNTDCFLDINQLCLDTCPPVLWGVYKCGTHLIYPGKGGLLALKSGERFYGFEILWYHLSSAGELTVATPEVLAEFKRMCKDG